RALLAPTGANRTAVGASSARDSGLDPATHAGVTPPCLSRSEVLTRSQGMPTCRRLEWARLLNGDVVVCPLSELELFLSEKD
ncbi:MAG: hypothetical protein L0Y45_01550, partial [Woeseiaceae bacterium]|nr:hypothetical protein [Woeseiaceae bacterium]